MFTPTERFITEMKLRELRKQREKLLAKYGEIDETAADSDAQRLRFLYDELQELTFAQQKLHPDVGNLNVLLHELTTKTSGVSNFWLDQLRQELESGKRRSEIVYVFGELVQAWMSQTSTDSTEQDEFQAAMLQYLSAPNTPNFGRIVDEMLAGGVAFQTPPDKLRARVTAEELKDILMKIRGDGYRPTPLRDEADHFVQDAALTNELADALTIMLDNLDDWDWDSEGVPTHIVWMRRKWRLLLDEPLPTACLLEILGKRWSAAFDQLTGNATRTAIPAWKRYNPAIQKWTKEELALVSQLMTFEKGFKGDLWTDLIDTKSPQEYFSKRWGTATSLVDQRAQLTSTLQETISVREYGRSASSGGGGMIGALKLIHTDVQLARAAYPDKPLHVLRFDLQDFYPSLSHALILRLLSRLSISEGDYHFFERFLSVPLKTDSGTVRVQRSVPINCGLSHSLGELLLRLMERVVQRAARVNIIRMVDDVCVLALSADEMRRAWQAIQNFCAACGLSLNPQKLGYACIGGKPIADMPENLPGWLMLTLDSQAEWRVNEAELQTLLEQTRVRIEGKISLIGQVEQYNDGVEFLLNSIGLGAALGDTHRTSVSEAVTRFHYNFFDANQGIDTAIRARINEQVGQADIPEGWLYYPITAGGLGLTQPLVNVTAYTETYRKLEKPKAPAKRENDWQQKANNEWVVYLRALLTDVKQAAPRQTDVMETLVKDFIQRGSKITGGKQQSLSPYWRWILYTYGPQLLEQFGTFRFLITELVPVQLILQKRRGVADEG
jgi:hypothetical protein